MEMYPVDAEVDSERLNRRFGGGVVLRLLERKRMGVDVGFACRYVTGWAAVDDIDGLGLAGLDDNPRRACKSTMLLYASPRLGPSPGVRPSHSRSFGNLRQAFAGGMPRLGF
jgi:hypothetical protein